MKNDIENDNFYFFQFYVVTSMNIVTDKAIVKKTSPFVKFHYYNPVDEFVLRKYFINGEKVLI